MNITSLARAALVAGAVTGASIGLAGNACAANPAHTTAPVSSIVAPNVFQPAPVTALGSWRGKKDDDGGDDGGGDVGGGDDGGDYSSAPDVSDIDPGPDVSDVQDDPAPEDDAPDVSEAPDVDPAPEAPDVDPAPVAPEIDPAPEAPEAPETPAPEAPETDPAPAPPAGPDAGLDSPPVDVDPTSVTGSDIATMTSSIFGSSTTSSSWTTGVSTWNSSWLSYSTAGQPILFNSFATPMQVVYTYGGSPWTVTIPPRQRAVLPVTTPGQYGFTALTRGPSGAVNTVTVGNFTGGGPAPHGPAPQPQRNVWVQLTYSTGTSQPFRVTTLTDLGEDSAVGGHRVLIDGTVSAWGDWSKNADGSQQFEVTKTDQLPGLSPPAEAPLPGYNVALAASESATKSGVMKVLPWVALAAGGLGLGSVGGALLIGRCRRAGGSQR
ncbi:hypothetical protein [Mycobacterium sp. 236(2023)]|uniref:hypothetical protein n=1 Tax=Mycobacterium sp. 236(2023) TaxID=3038163 RepID=UPI0024153F69|nr:hypothetical protein [Mycobacterium sp. 236(2023)]MDG4667581.1 hypothetical protein [Mycobacterium sp. 236(2023)]